MEMKGGTSLKAYIKHMKEVADRVAAIDASISEEDQVVTLLGSLPHSYSTIVSALEAQGADNLSLSFVQQALVNEELKLSGDSVCTLLMINHHQLISKLHFQNENKKTEKAD